MNKKALICSLIVLLLFMTNIPSLEAGNLSGQIDFLSRYIWRGFDNNPNKKPALQPSLTYIFGGSGFAVNAWFSVSFEPDNKALNETNITFSYDFKLAETLSLSAGVIHYGFYLADNFSFDQNTTHELFLAAALPKLPLNPSAIVYYDFHNEKALYISCSLSHSLKPAPAVTVDLTASLGYNGGQYLIGDSGFSDLTIGAAVPLKLGEIAITVLGNYTFVLLDEIGDDNHFWFGLSLAF